MKIKLLIVILLLAAICSTISPQQVKITVGILNFDNNSIMDRDKLDPLSKGLAAIMSTELEQIKAFKITERQRLNDILNELKFQQSGAVDPATIQKIGKIIGARALLLGSFMNFGGKIRIDVRVVEVETGLTMKAEEETGSLEDMFTVVKNLSKKIPKNFDLELSDDEREAIYGRGGSKVFEANLFYSKGVAYEDLAREFANRGANDSALTNMHSALAMYQEAVKLSADFKIAQEKIDQLKRQIIGFEIKKASKVYEAAAGELKIFEPDLAAGQEFTIREKSITIRGKYPAGDSFKEITINGVKASLISGNEFFCNVQLSPGKNEITVKAVPGEGQPKEIHFTIIQANESDKPLLVVLSPKIEGELNSARKSGSVQVRGIVVDKTAVKSISVNKTEYPVNPNGEFNITLPLNDGENKLVLKALGEGGRVTEQMLSLERPAQLPQLSSSAVRHALVIGNSNYSFSPLKNPVNDATAVSASLKELGFMVDSYYDVATEKDLKKIARDFGAKLKDGGIGLVYYSGHGLQVKGVNYLVPVKAEITKEEDVEFEAMDLNLLLAEMEVAKNPSNIVILDACRNNPFKKSTRSAGAGLAQVLAPAGTLIAFSTAPGAVASDGSGANGLYTGELLKAMKIKGLKIEDIFKIVRANVRQNSNNEQIPWENTSLEGDIYLNNQ